MNQHDNQLTISIKTRQKYKKQNKRYHSQICRIYKNRVDLFYKG